MVGNLMTVTGYGSNYFGLTFRVLTNQKERRTHSTFFQNLQNPQSKFAVRAIIEGKGYAGGFFLSLPNHQTPRERAKNVFFKETRKSRFTIVHCFVQRSIGMCHRGKAE